MSETNNIILQQYLNINVNLLLFVTINHCSILDNKPVLGTLQVDGNLLDRGDHLVSVTDTLDTGWSSGV